MWVMGREWPWHVNGTTLTVSEQRYGQRVVFQPSVWLQSRLEPALFHSTGARTGSHCGRGKRGDAGTESELLVRSGAQGGLADSGCRSSCRGTKEGETWAREAESTVGLLQIQTLEASGAFSSVSNVQMGSRRKMTEEIRGCSSRREKRCSGRGRALRESRGLRLQRSVQGSGRR